MVSVPHERTFAPRTFRPLRLLNTYTGHRSAVYALAPAAEPGTFFSAGSDGTVVRWNCGTPNDGTGIAQLPRPVFSVCHMNYHILAGLDDGAIHVLDLITQREVRNLRLHAKGAFALQIVQPTWTQGMGPRENRR